MAIERDIDAHIMRNYVYAIDDEHFPVTLRYLTYISWYYAYVFKPGTTRSEIHEIIGFEDEDVPAVVVEDYTQMLLVRTGAEGANRRVAINIHGRKPYRFYVDFQSKNYVRLTSWARCRAEVDADGTIKLFIDPNPFGSWENMVWSDGITSWPQLSAAVAEFRVELYVYLINELYNGDFDRDFWFPDIAAFRWDYAYVFKPGMTRDEIEDIIGLEYEGIPDVIEDGYTQMLFVNTYWEIVVSIYDDLPFRFHIEGTDDFEHGNYARITNQARCRLVVEPDGSVTIVITDVRE
jgi:hypothetical protein